MCNIPKWTNQITTYRSLFAIFSFETNIFIILISFQEQKEQNTQKLINFTFMWPCIVTNFFVIKPTRCTNFTNWFCHETLHVSDSSSVHHQEFIHYSQLSCKSICSCSKAVYKTVWHIPLLSVQWINSWWWTEELSETCRVSCRSKFGKLVHLVGFITNETK
jgi:hypothetical protein